MQRAIGAASCQAPCEWGDGSRYRLALRGRSVRSIALKLTKDGRAISPSHLQRIINGERPATADILAALRAAVGDAGWAYATGQSDWLPMEGEK